MTTATATHMDKKAIMRDKRAQGIAAMGLVTREGDRFRVTTPSLRGKRTQYEVWRDEAGRVRCSCLEYTEQSVEDAGYRCEHILAVKHSLTVKPAEAAQPKQPTPNVAARAAIKESAAQATPNTNTTASEKRTSEPERAAAERFAREQDEPKGVVAETEPVTNEQLTVAPLAEQNNVEEQTEMTKKASAPARPAEDSDFVTAEEHEAMQVGQIGQQEQQSGSVVPLAFTNTLRTLRQPIDPRLVKSREGWRDRNGNVHTVEYVEWHTVADLLDRVAPTWSHAVRGIVQIGDMVAVTAAITIDGVTREGVGTGTADNETGIKKAEHDALKRAAIKFGIARDLYQRESEVIEREGAGPQAGDMPRDPLAKSMADLVTPKQLGMIRALAREAGIDADEECQQVARCRTEELSKKAASSFIDHLKGLQHESFGNQSMRRAS
jgi:hypothetical protein